MPRKCVGDTTCVWATQHLRRTQSVGDTKSVWETQTLRGIHNICPGGTYIDAKNGQQRKVPCTTPRPKSKSQSCECFVMVYTTIGFRSIREQKRENTSRTSSPSHTHTYAHPRHNRYPTPPGAGKNTERENSHQSEAAFEQSSAYL